MPYSARERQISTRKFIRPYAFLPFGMIGITMILMDRENAAGSIDNGNARLKRLPYEPVIPTNAADNKCRYLLVVQVPCKTEIVNPPAISLVICFARELANFIAPPRAGEINGLRNLGVPPPDHHQKCAVRLTDKLDCMAKIRSQDNVAIHVA